MLDVEVSQWIAFTVAENDDPLSIVDGSATGKAWKEIMAPFLSAPGLYRCLWGREQEDTHRVIIVAVWKQGSAAEQFEAGDESRTFWTKLTQRCTTPPSSMFVDFDSKPFYISLQGYTEIVRVRLPVANRRHPQEAVPDFPQGMTNRIGRNGRAQDIHRQGPSRGRVLNPAEDAETFIFCQHWLNADTERAFKAQTGSTFPVPGETRLENWHAKLRAAGAVGWEHAHFNFTSVPRGV